MPRGALGNQAEKNTALVFAADSLVYFHPLIRVCHFFSQFFFFFVFCPLSAICPGTSLFPDVLLKER